MKTFRLFQYFHKAKNHSYDYTAEWGKLLLYEHPKRCNMHLCPANERPSWLSERRETFLLLFFFLKVMSESIYLENVEASAFEVMNATLKASDSKSLPFRAPTCPSCHRPHHLFSSCCYQQH